MKIFFSLIFSVLIILASSLSYAITEEIEGLRIIVINLQRSKDRLEIMKKQLNDLELKYEIFNAVDGQKLTDEDLKKYSFYEAYKQHGRSLTPGEIGCALSHVKIYESCLGDCLILEDDVIIDKNIIEVLKNRSKFPSDWELINFYTDAEQIPFGKPFYKDYRFTKFQGDAVNRTAAILVSIKGVKKLLNVAYPIRWAADGLTGNKLTNSGIISYGITPRLITLQNVDSTIGTR